MLLPSAPFPNLPPNRLPDLLRAILFGPDLLTHPTEFRFEWTPQAAAHNLRVLRRYDLSLQRALDHQPFSILTPGSEFRPAPALAPLCSPATPYGAASQRISFGAEFPLAPISDIDRRSDVRTILARGNHKSARDHEQRLLNMLKDEVERGWQLPLREPIQDGIARYDCYLDDMFGVFHERDRVRAEAALPLALHLVGRPLSLGSPESFPRDNLLAESKFLAEAKASERKTILGWEVNTRTFLVSLPKDKHQVWKKDLFRLADLPGRRATTKDIETMIGRLNHAAYVVPNSRPFLGRLYRACERSKAVGSVKLSDSQVVDLKLWALFLDDAARGISINRLVFRWPSRVIRVDACPELPGGFILDPTSSAGVP